MMRSFADPDTHYELITTDAPEKNEEGPMAGRPTGEVRCEACGAVAMNVDDIPHEQDCPQRGVHSRWYAMSFFGPEAVDN